MSTYQQNVVKCNRKKLQSKTKYVAQEANVIASSLNEIISELHRKTNALLKENDKIFSSRFEEMNEVLESTLEKLFIVQATIDPGIQETVALLANDVIGGSENYSSIDSVLSPEASCLVESQQDMTTSFLDTESSLMVNAVPGHSPLEFIPTTEGVCSGKMKYKTLQSKSSLQSNISCSIFENASDMSNCSGSEIEGREIECGTWKSSNIETQLAIACVNNTFSASSQSSLQNFASFNHDNNKATNGILPSCLLNPVNKSSYIKGSKQSVLNRTKLLDSDFSNHSNNQKSIPQPDVKLGDHLIAVIKHFINPSDFWMQIENSTTKDLCPVSVSLCASLEQRTIAFPYKKNDFCLAPFQQRGSFYRARILNFLGTEKIQVEVFYVDHGSKGSTSIFQLQPMPEPLYNCPALAIHCTIHGVSPANEIWSPEANREFEETYKYSTIKPYIYSKVGGKYSVGLSITAEREDFTYDMSQMLISYGFAVLENKGQTNIKITEADLEAQPGCLEEISNSLMLQKNSIQETQNNLGSSNSSSVIGNQSHFTISDVNVAVELETSKNPVPEQLFSSKNLNGDKNLSIELHPVGNQENEIERYEIQVNMDEVCNLQKPESGNHTVVQNVMCKNASSSAKHLDQNVDSVDHKKSVDIVASLSNDYDWNVTIPVPDFNYVKGDKVVIMMSSVTNPLLLYVHAESINITDFDDLQEQLPSACNSCNSSEIVFSENIVQPNMFCCCRHSVDKNWYRAKILGVCHPKNVKGILFHVQYVDYGDKDFVSIQDIRPLTKTFAKYPSFSICCALAGIKPKLSKCENKSDKFCIEDNNSVWSKEAIEKLKFLVPLEKFYTAEIAISGCYQESCPIPIYLWDTDSFNDILINDLLIEQGIADKLDFSLSSIPTSENKNCGNNYSGDPMSEDYYSSFNSYGVNLDDAEMAIIGYRANDEKYICKYYSQSGKCHRGDNCPYQHVEVYNGQTQDKQAIHFLGDNISLPEISDYLLISVSAVFDPSHFFVIFPYGTKPVSQLFKSNVYSSCYKETEDLNVLMEHMRNHYNKIPFSGITTVALACGDLVAAKSKIDGYWCRARVIEVFDISTPVQVFFVDFGNCEFVDRTDIHILKLEYRHLPFQAVECRQDSINPINYNGNPKWSKESRIKFLELVEGKIIFAQVTNKIGSVLHLELCSTLENKLKINECLVEAGYAHYTQQSVPPSSCDQEIVNTKSKISLLLLPA